MSEARKQQPQAILLNVDLPELGGFLLLERLKANRVAGQHACDRNDRGAA